MSKNKVFVLIDIRNDWVTWIVKHLRSPVALLDRCCRVPFWRKVGEISRRWQFCDMKNATKYLVVGSLGVLMTRRDISSLAVKGLRMLKRIPEKSVGYRMLIYSANWRFIVFSEQISFSAYSDTIKQSLWLIVHLIYSFITTDTIRVQQCYIVLLWHICILFPLPKILEIKKRTAFQPRCQ